MKSLGTVLVVDDEQGFRENIVERLVGRGFDVLEAGEGEAALAHAKDQYIDVALVDIHMPGMDGLELLQRLKEIDPLMEVVMVTGQGTIETAEEAMRHGAHHYVTKPVRLGELEMAVRRALEKSTLARQNQVFREH
ncbi:MAG: response regulator [Planctomycetota bacterium]|jgi:DNA-binding NtrC family response regulator|nr:response regulator [Planctomycetota bacterium]